LYANFLVLILLSCSKIAFENRKKFQKACIRLFIRNLLCLCMESQIRKGPLFHLCVYRQFGMGLREQHPDPLLKIHPETAAGMHLHEGDWAKIETPRGAIVMKIQLAAGIDLRVMQAEHCWWFPEQPGAEPSRRGLWQSNVNVLTTDDLDACNRVAGSRLDRGLLSRVNRVPSA
jgi:predicted molibdopterin-dependent oxidoreductase YjgC